MKNQIIASVVLAICLVTPLRWGHASPCDNEAHDAILVALHTTVRAAVEADELAARGASSSTEIADIYADVITTSANTNGDKTVIARAAAESYLSAATVALNRYNTIKNDNYKYINNTSAYIKDDATKAQTYASLPLIDSQKSYRVIKSIVYQTRGSTDRDHRRIHSISSNLLDNYDDITTAAKVAVNTAAIAALTLPPALSGRIFCIFGLDRRMGSWI